MPGGALNTAGGKMQEAGFIDAAKTIHLSDFNEVHKKPCARDAFMTGIGAGFGVGGVRAILGGILSAHTLSLLQADHPRSCSPMLQLGCWVFSS